MMGTASPTQSGTGSDIPLSKRLRLSLEPPVLVDAAQRLAAEKADRMLKQRKVADFDPEGEPIYEDDEKSRDSLSARLQRLWEERGDFSQLTAASLQPDAPSAEAVNADDAIEDDEEDAEGQAKHRASSGNAGKTAKAEGRVSLSTSELWDLKREMLARLGMARNESALAHTLVSLLIASSRPLPGTAFASNERAFSPALSATGTATGTSAVGASDDLPLDAHALTVTTLQPDAPDEDTNPREKSNRDLRLLLAQKRAAIRSAADILRGGASQLEVQAEQARQLWTRAGQAHQRGWGVAPGRPLKERAAGSKEVEGARDVWIGYAVPEAPASLHRRALAYFSDSAVDRSSTSDASTSVTASTSHLSFRDRPRRRLRVSFVLDSGDSESEPQIWASSSTSERWDERGTPRDENQDSDTDVANDPLGDIKGKGKQKEATREVDDELSAAQNELLDEELFAELITQGRALLNSVNITMIEGTLTVELTPVLSLRFEMVSSEDLETAQKEMQSDDPAREASSARSSIADLILAFLRLLLVRRYRQQAHATATTATDAQPGTGLGRPNAVSTPSKGTPQGRKPPPPSGPTTNGEEDPSRAPALLSPVLEALHFLSFVQHTRSLLESLTAPIPEARFTFDALESIVDARRWVRALVEGPRRPFTDQSGPATTVNTISQPGRSQPSSGAATPLANPSVRVSAPAEMGGTATVYLGERCVAHLTLSAPSRLTAHFPARSARAALPLDLAALEELLVRELRVQGSQ